MNKIALITLASSLNTAYSQSIISDVFESLEDVSFMFENKLVGNQPKDNTISPDFSFDSSQKIEETITKKK